MHPVFPHALIDLWRHWFVTSLICDETLLICCVILCKIDVNNWTIRISTGGFALTVLPLLWGLHWKLFRSSEVKRWRIIHERFSRHKSKHLRPIWTKGRRVMKKNDVVKSYTLPHKIIIAGNHQVSKPPPLLLIINPGASKVPPKPEGAPWRACSWVNQKSTWKLENHSFYLMSNSRDSKT